MHYIINIARKLVRKRKKVKKVLKSRENTGRVAHRTTMYAGYDNTYKLKEEEKKLSERDEYILSDVGCFHRPF